MLHSAGERLNIVALALLNKRTRRFATILIVSVALALLAYVTLDTIYFHVFFSAENADVASIIPALIVVVSLCLAIIVRRTDSPSGSA